MIYQSSKAVQKVVGRAPDQLMEMREREVVSHTLLDFTIALTPTEMYRRSYNTQLSKTRSMVEVYLIPADGRHLKTVTDGVEYDEIKDVLSFEENANLNVGLGNQRPRFWGSLESVRSTWESMNIGDVALFIPSGTGVYKYACSILYKHHNPKLAQAAERLGYWSRAGSNYERIFYLRNFKEIDIRKAEVNRIGDWGPAVPYRLMRVASPVVKDWILDQIKPGKVERYLETPAASFPAKPTRTEIKDMIRRIGTFEGKVTETDYELPKYKVDALWKNLSNGGPAMVFEVQVGEDLDKALVKLLYTRLVWNSTPVLVTDEENEKDVRNKLEGSFQDLRGVLKVWRWEKVVELYQSLAKSAQVKTDLGL